MDEFDYFPSSGKTKNAVRGEVLPKGHIRKHLLGDIRKLDGYVYVGHYIDKKTNRFVEKWLKPSLAEKRKEKDKEYKANRYATHKKEILLLNKLARQKNLNKYRARELKNKNNHRDKYNKQHAEWTKRNRSKVNHWRKDRKVRIKHGKLMLHKDQESIIKTIYGLSTRVSECTGIKHHVDHIIPISRGGYHIHTNMQVLPEKINLRKANKLPHEFFLAA